MNTCTYIHTTYRDAAASTCGHAIRDVGGVAVAGADVRCGGRDES